MLTRLELHNPYSDEKGRANRRALRSIQTFQHLTMLKTDLRLLMGKAAIVELFGAVPPNLVTLEVCDWETDWVSKNLDIILASMARWMQMKSHSRRTKALKAIVGLPFNVMEKISRRGLKGKLFDLIGECKKGGVSFEIVVPFRVNEISCRTVDLTKENLVLNQILHRTGDEGRQQ